MTIADISKFMTIDIGDISSIMTIPVNAATYGNRGVFGGGASSAVIDYITISTPGNAVDFGDLTTEPFRPGAFSNGAYDRGIIGGGTNAASSLLNTIGYVTISTTGNAIDFGDLTLARAALGGTSNGTNDRGIFLGGYTTTDVNTIDYVTISTAGNAVDFGNLSTIRRTVAGCSNSINERGICAGGYGAGTRYNIIEYVTINSTGNATDFGDLAAARSSLAATDNGTNGRGVIGGGYESADSNRIEYITIATTGNGTDFGDLTVARYYLGATSNSTDETGVFAGGTGSGGASNVLDYITINSTGNATDFGDQSVTRYGVAGCSNGAARVAPGTSNRGIFPGGYASGAYFNTIEYITINILCNGTDFGDLSVNRGGAPGSNFSNSTNDRGVVGPYSIYTSSTIDYITISVLGNALDFGDVSVARSGVGGFSNGTNDRGCYTGGYTGAGSNVIDYITISTTGNATDFGNLFQTRWTSSGSSNGTNERGLTNGGYIGGTSRVNTIDYVTINSAGNATDFGNLTVGRAGSASTSNGTNERGITGGGYNDSVTFQNVIDYVTINSTGNSTDFGDLSVINQWLGVTSNNTLNRAVFAGGWNGGVANNQMEYVTISTKSNVSDFGDLATAMGAVGGMSNS